MSPLSCGRRIGPRGRHGAQERDRQRSPQDRPNRAPNAPATAQRSRGRQVGHCWRQRGRAPSGRFKNQPLGFTGRPRASLARRSSDLEIATRRRVHAHTNANCFLVGRVPNRKTESSVGVDLSCAFIRSSDTNTTRTNAWALRSWSQLLDSCAVKPIAAPHPALDPG